MGVDTACLSDYVQTNTCVEGYNFFIINQQQGFDIDGIISMAPPFLGNVSFIQVLIDQGQLSEPVVGFQLTT
jgi:hypothetical protein